MPDPIQGSLPWSSGGASMDFTGNPAGLSNSYASAYNASLGMNQANYNNILSGYQNTMAAQTQAQNAVSSGYGDLSSSVLGGIRDIGAARSQDIASQYTQASANAAQNLVGRGLGNTTVANTVQRGIDLDKTRADTNLANTLAQTTAGYQSSLGLAGLGYAGQAAAQNTDQANRQLGFMNSVSAGYPDASQYTRLAQMYGAGQMGAADRAQQQDALSRLHQQGMGGFVPRGTTSYSPGGSALTGRPSAGLFSNGGGGSSGLGGTGTPLGMAGNYFGTGTPQPVGGTGDDGYLTYDEGDAGTGGLASSLGLAADQAAYYGNGLGGGYGDYLSGGSAGYYGYGALGGADDGYLAYED